MELVLIFITVVAASFAFYYFLQTRSYKYKGKFYSSKFYNSKTNITMGIMLISMACIQLFTFPDPTWIRWAVGLVFLLLGGFNLYMGMKHYKFYLPQAEKENMGINADR